MDVPKTNVEVQLFVASLVLPPNQGQVRLGWVGLGQVRLGQDRYNLKVKVEAFAVQEKVSESRLRKAEELDLYQKYEDILH